VATRIVLWLPPYSPDSQHLATASRDKTARVWDIAGEQEVLRLANPAGGVKCMALSPDGKRLAIGNQDDARDKTTSV